MKKLMLDAFRFTFSGFVLGLLLFACNRDNEISPAQKQERASRAAEDNSQIIATTQDVLSVSDGAFESQGISDGRATSGGRIEALTDGEIGIAGSNCPSTITGSFTMDKTHPDTLIFNGSLSIDFGDGSACQDTTNVKKGKFTDTFSFTFVTSPSFKFVSSSQMIVFAGFSRGSKTIDGTIIAKTQKAGTSTIEFQGAKITYADGTSTSWAGTFTIVDNKFGTLNTGDDQREVTGSISGTSRDGAAFSANITKTVLFKYACFKRRDIPVSGTVALEANGTSSTLDFGDGRCDKVYVVTTGGTSTDHNF